VASEAGFCKPHRAYLESQHATRFRSLAGNRGGKHRSQVTFRAPNKGMLRRVHRKAAYSGWSDRRASFLSRHARHRVAPLDIQSGSLPC